MSLWGRLAHRSENLFCLRNCAFAKWNTECASFSKKVDLPSPPKRPLTAYMIFCKENRHGLLQERPGLSSPEQIKELAKKWSLLSVDMKKPYEVTAREETQMYGEEHKKFYQNLTEEQKEALYKLKDDKMKARKASKLKRALKESGLPRPAVAAYSLFVQSQAGKEPSKIASDFLKECAEKWKALSDAEKKSLEGQAQKEKLRYATELEKWKARLVKEGKTDLLREFSLMRGKGKFFLDEPLPAKEKKSNPQKAPKSKTAKN